MSDTTSPPAPDGLPVLGNGLAFSRDPVAAMESWATHGDVVRLRFFGESMYLVTGPELVKEILVERQHQFSIGPRQRESFRGVEDHAMTTAAGDRWSRLRRAAHPAFTRERVAAYSDRAAAVTARFVDGWADGERFDLHREMRRLTVQILGEALFSADLRGREGVVLSASDSFLARTNFRRPGQLLPSWVPTPTSYRFRRDVGRLDDLVEELLAARRDRPAAAAGEAEEEEEEEEAGEEQTEEDVCSVLLAAQDAGELTAAEVRENLVAFLLAGHESPAGALTRVWYLLDDHPDAKRAVRAEADRVVDGDRPTAADYESLTETRRVVREALRLYPPTTGVNRQATEPVSLGGYEFPAGAQFLVPQWVPHRDERFWDDPEAFDPSRWGRDVDRPEYAYFPFSGGPRGCIGAEFARRELALAVAATVDRVDLDVTAGDGETSLSFVPSIQLRPETELSAVVDEREV